MDGDLGRQSVGQVVQLSPNGADVKTLHRAFRGITAAASTNRCSMSGRLRLDHAIDPLAIRLLGLQGSPSFLRTTPARKPRTE